MSTHFTLTDRRLFRRKLTALAVGTLAFVPLVYFRLDVPAYLYGGGLLLLHLYFLYLYFTRTPWRQLLHYPALFSLRTVAVIFFMYLLSLIHFGGTPAQVIGKLSLAFAIHIGILLGLTLVPAPYRGETRVAG